MLSIIYTALTAQHARPLLLKKCPVKTINFEQGLINIAITSAITDNIGFTWFSTHTGLQRYNGSILQTVSPVVAKDTISITYPVFFLANGSSTFLIGYKYGVLEFNARSNSFRSIVLLKPGKPLHYSLVPIREDKEGVWCLEENQGIICFRADGTVNHPFKDFPPASVDSVFHSSDFFQNKQIVAEDSNFIFIRVSPKAVAELGLKSRSVLYLDFPGESVCGIACTQDYVFVASNEDLLSVRIKDGKVAYKAFYRDIVNEQVNFSCIELTPSGHLLLSAAKHLYEFDTSCTCLDEITNPNGEPFVNTGDVPFLYEDKFSRIWLLTLDEIKRIQNTAIPFEHLIYPADKNNFVRSLYVDEQKKILLAGCFNGGIQLYDTAGKPLWRGPLMTKTVKDILSIDKLSPDNYLVVTWRKGLYVLNIEKKTIREISLAGPLCSLMQIQKNTYSNCLQRIDESTCMISTSTNVYRCIFDKSNLLSATPLFDTSWIDQRIVSSFLCLKDGTLWAGTELGVVLRRDRQGTLSTFDIPGNYFIRCMAEDAIHNVWVGTEKGLFVYTPSGRLILKVTKESGLLNDFIYALSPDKGDRDFFVSTNLGISFISSSGKVRNYTRELGLQANEFNTQSTARASSGKIFFGGINGITAFYPSALVNKSDTPSIHITRLVVNDSLYNLFAGAWDEDKLQLPYNQNHLQLNVAAFGILDPDEYLYKYRLRNFEDIWQVTHQPSDIKYTLPPGEYVLDIYCSPLLSPDSSFHKELVIVVRPPWWQTWWFRIVAFCLLVLGITFVVWRYNKARYQEQIRVLRTQTAIQGERERISRELHDNIGTQLSYISSNVDWMIDASDRLTREQEQGRLSVINKTTKETISDLRETIWAMKKASVPLDELADKVKYFLQAQLLLKPDMHLDIQEDIRLNILFSPTEALNIFRVCQEAIVNSVKHAAASVLIFSIRSETTGTFHIIIEDNGQGFDLNNIYDGHYGLENMRQRAESLGGSVTIKSVKGSGTRIDIIRQGR